MHVDQDALGLLGKAQVLAEAVDACPLVSAGLPAGAVPRAVRRPASALLARGLVPVAVVSASAAGISIVPVATIAVTVAIASGLLPVGAAPVAVPVLSSRLPSAVFAAPSASIASSAIAIAVAAGTATLPLGVTIAVAVAVTAAVRAAAIGPRVPAPTR